MSRADTLGFEVRQHEGYIGREDLRTMFFMVRQLEGEYDGSLFDEEAEAAEAELGQHLQTYAWEHEEDKALFVVWQGMRLGLGRTKHAAGIATVHIDGTEAHIPEIVMSPRESVRGLGLGRLLLERSIDWADQRGATTLQVDRSPQNEAAHRLLKSLDFMPSSGGLPVLRLDEAQQPQSLLA